MDKKIDKKRVTCCFCYLILAIGLLLVLLVIKCPPDLKEVIVANIGLILWCTFWAAFGISLGLWNRRYSESQPLSHYYMYYLFVLFFATTSAVAISSSETISIRLYVLSLATSLAIGFCGDYLLEILKNKSKEGQKTNE
jgi:hypothetical protein